MSYVRMSIGWYIWQGRTKVQNSGLFTKSVRVGIIRGRACPAENLGTGIRGLMPITAIPESTKFIMAHIRNVHRNPTLSSRALTTSGKMNPINSKILEPIKVTWDQYRKLPPMPEPAKIIPAARPRRCENHSGSSKITGIKSNPSPIPNSTPCSSMSCHTWPVRISNAMTWNPQGTYLVRKARAKQRHRSKNKAKPHRRFGIVWVASVK